MSMIRNKAMLAKIVSMKSNTPVLVVIIKQLGREGPMQRGDEYIIVIHAAEGFENGHLTARHLLPNRISLEITGRRYTDCCLVSSHLDKKGVKAHKIDKLPRKACQSLIKATFKRTSPIGCSRSQNMSVKS